jgi:hypothetical protein
VVEQTQRSSPCVRVGFLPAEVQPQDLDRARQQLLQRRCAGLLARWLARAAAETAASAVRFLQLLGGEARHLQQVVGQEAKDLVVKLKWNSPKTPAEGSRRRLTVSAGWPRLIAAPRRSVSSLLDPPQPQWHAHVDMSRRTHLIVALAALALAGSTSGTAATAAAPPPSLTQYGRLLWNLDALLRDRFGRRVFYLQYLGFPKSATASNQHWNFSTQFVGDCCSAPWHLTFAGASGSAFQTVALAQPPQAAIGAAGGEMPLTIGGRYIYCGAGGWLYTHYGNGSANFQLDCIGRT